MDVWFRKFLSQIAFYMMRALDGMLELFTAFTGLRDVNVQGEPQGKDILSIFIDNPSVRTAGIYIILLCVGILGIFTMIAVVKTMATTKKTQSKVLGQFCAALVAFFLAQAIILTGIAVSNEVLRIVDTQFKASQDGNDLKLSQQLFDLSVGEYYDNHTAKDFDAKASPSDVWGQYKEHGITGMEKAPDYYEEITDDNGTTWVGDDPIKKGIANLYSANLLILCLAPLILLMIIGIALIKLSMRIFNVMLLYLCAPFFISSIPLDEGSRFKLWREQTISQTLSIYGTVVAFNIFIFALGVIKTLSVGGSGGDSQFWGNIFKLILIIGAAFTAKGGADLFASMLGGQPHQSGNLGQAIYSGMQGMALGGALARGGTSLLFGRRGGGGGAGGGASQGGSRGMGGLLGGAAKTADFGLKVLFGNKYENTKAAASQWNQGLKNSLRGKTTDGKDSNQFMKSGGLLGGTSDTLKRMVDKDDMTGGLLGGKAANLKTPKMK